MKIELFWCDRWNDGKLFPEAKCYNISNDFKGLVFNFLNDDEGHGLKFLIPWIDEGLIEVEKIKKSILDYYDMWGHAWGAEINNKNVLIYWGYDDTKYEEHMSFECFYKILREWSQFIKAQPSLDYKVEFEC